MIFRAETLIERKMLFCTYRAIRLNNADLRKQYLGPKPLLRKRCYYELIRAVRHNNADLKNLSELSGTIMPT